MQATMTPASASTGQADSLGQTVSALGFGALATATSVRIALAGAAGLAAPALALVRTKPLEEREPQEEAAVPGD